MLSSVILTFSCTNDSNLLENETNLSEQNERKSVLKSNESEIIDDVDKIFYEYFNSTLVQETDLYVENFYYKLKKDKNFENIDTKSKMESWIAANIDYTLFENYQDAINQYNILLSKINLLNESYPQFYNYLVEATIDEATFRFEKWNKQNINLTAEESSTCDYQLKQCRNAVSEKFIQEVKNSMEIEDQFEKSTKQGNSKAEYNNGMNKCRDNYSKCKNY